MKMSAKEICRCFWYCLYKHCWKCFPTISFNSNFESV